jgi:hypothetical protein
MLPECVPESTGLKKLVCKGQQKEHFTSGRESYQNVAHEIEWRQG